MNERKQMKDKLIKYATWRLLGGLGTGLIVWTVLWSEGNIPTSLALPLAGTSVLVDVVVKHVSYVLHGAVWRKFSKE